MKSLDQFSLLISCFFSFGPVNILRYAETISLKVANCIHFSAADDAKIFTVGTYSFYVLYTNEYLRNQWKRLNHLFCVCVKNF